MTIHSWTFPAIQTGRADCQTTWNNMLENLMTNHAGAADAPTPQPYMWQVRSDEGKLYMWDGSGATKYFVADVKDGMGLIRDTGGTMTGELDLGGQAITEPTAAAVTGAMPAPTYRFGVKIGGTVRWAALTDTPWT